MLKILPVVLLISFNQFSNISFTDQIYVVITEWVSEGQFVVYINAWSMF